MKNKISYVLCIVFIFICTILTGCISNNNRNEDLSNNETYSLVSTPDRLVFKKSNNYEVYYIDNNIVTKIEKVKAFSNEDYANEYYAKQNALQYKSVRCMDALVIFEMNDEYLNENKYLTETDLVYNMKESGFTKVNDE